MLCSILRASAAGTRSIRRSSIPILSSSAHNYSSKNTKTNVTKAKKTNSKASGKKSATDDHATAADNDIDAALSDTQARLRRHEADDKDPSLDVGANGRPLFTSPHSLSLLSRKDTCLYFKFRDTNTNSWTEDLNKVLPGRLPVGMVDKFEDSLRPALLVRQSFLDLRDNFRRIVDPLLRLSDDKGPKVKKQIVLDGPVSCSKSIALAMLVHWARDEGWLVFYVPRGREWTHGTFFSKNPDTGFWDTPLQAANVLKGAGVGRLKDVDCMGMPEGSTLSDLVDTGIKHSQAAVRSLLESRTQSRNA